MAHDPKNISLWFWFIVILSIAPLIFSIWKIYSESNPITFLEALEQVISHGELILICIPILGISIGDLYYDQSNRRESNERGIFKNEIKTSILGFNIILFFFCTATFVDISASANKKEISFILKSSIILLACTILVSLSSFIITRESNKYHRD